MTGLSFKSAVFSLVIVCFLGGSAVADTFTFTGEASYGDDSEEFFLSGPSFTIHSAFPGGPGGARGECSQGTLCTIPAQFIGTPAEFGLSGGTVGGVKADIFGSGQGLTFSGFSFTAGTDSPFGSGPMTFTGDLTGYVFDPPGCEVGVSCTGVGPQVFDLQLSGSGTGTATGIPRQDGTDLIIEYNYTFSGMATTAPEPSSLLLLSSGLIALVAIRRWHLLRRVNH
jgi:hypothetical protein